MRRVLLILTLAAVRTCLLVFTLLAVNPCRVWAQGDPLGPEFRVNTYTTSIQHHPSIAAIPNGGFVVVWQSEQDGSSYGVFGQRYASFGAALGTEFRVNTYTTSQQWYPSVAVDASGSFVVVWSSVGQDGSSSGVFGQRYVSSGAPLGAEFRVNTHTTSDQRFPSVAADSAGNFVVVWQSYNQDGSGDGVLGQRHDSSVRPLAQSSASTLTPQAISRTPR